MTSEERVQEALAAHLDYLESGGRAPDVSHLTDDERARLDELIVIVGDAEGMGFGRTAGDAPQPTTDEGRELLHTLQTTLPLGARVASDPATDVFTAEGVEVLDGFIVGTFGGRVRVWLLAGTDPLANAERWLRDLERIFRLFPDTAAIALVETDGSCLLVQPEDCAPTIEVPRGSLVGRRYRRPVHPVTEALPAFLVELVPHWEPLDDIGAQDRRAIDLQPLAGERAEQAIAEQVAAGGRARKTNPKRVALSGLGDGESTAIAELATQVHEGRASADDVEAALRRLATGR